MYNIVKIVKWNAQVKKTWRGVTIKIQFQNCIVMLKRKSHNQKQKRKYIFPVIFAEALKSYTRLLV